MLTSGFSFAASSAQLTLNYGRNQEKVATSIEQLSTGKRINRPSDDPGGFVAAEEIRGELIELRSEGNAATNKRINAISKWSESRFQQPVAEFRKPRLATDQSIDVLEDETVPTSATPDFGDTRIDEVFKYLREDKEVILTQALSQIEDTDFAVATTELVQGQVLSSAAIAALAYASHQMTEQVGQLIDTIDTASA